MSTEATKKDLVISRVFDAPIEAVWDAWRNPQKIKAWWGPDGFDCPLAEIDFRVGRKSLVAMQSPDFGTHYSTWDYEEIAPMERIAYIHNLADADGNTVDPVAMGMPSDFPQDQRHEVTFKALGETQTELVVTEYGWTVGHMMELSEMGMNQCLDKMAKLLENVE